MTAPKGSNPPKSAGLSVGFAADSTLRRVLRRSFFAFVSFAPSVSSPRSYALATRHRIVTRHGTSVTLLLGVRDFSFALAPACARARPVPETSGCSTLGWAGHGEYAL